MERIDENLERKRARKGESERERQTVTGKSGKIATLSKR